MSISIALDHFERVCKPSKLARITTKVIEDYVTQRRQEKGARGGPISPATINKELRHLKSALLYAHDAKDLPEVPKIRMLKEPGKLPTYVTPEHFTAIYEHCDAARNPKDLPYSPGEWWKALVVFCYMTGWRISEPLALRRNDLNLEEGTAITRAADNKGGRDEIVPLHPVVLEHLNTIKSFESVVFPWYRTREQLWVEFRRIQEAAGIHLPCSKADEHNCTPACHVYGFHDLRRAFATVNAQTLSADALQRLMRHKDYSTTQRYINLAEQVNKAVENLHVPEVLKTAKGA